MVLGDRLNDIALRWWKEMVNVFRFIIDLFIKDLTKTPIAGGDRQCVRLITIRGVSIKSYAIASDYFLTTISKSTRIFALAASEFMVFG